MQATITYMLTEQAQRAAIAATGQPVARKLEKTIEITPSDLALMSVDDNGVASLDITRASSVYTDVGRALIAAGWSESKGSHIPEAPSADVDVLADVRRGSAIVAAETAEAEARAAETRRIEIEKAERAIDMFLADPGARGSIGSGGSIQFADAGLTTLSRTGDGYSVSVDPSPRANQARLEIRRRYDADTAAKKAAEAAKEQAKHDFIGAWMRAHGEPQQFLDGLLDRAEAIAMIADAEFAKLGLEKYDANICNNSHCSCGRTDVKTVPTSVYPALRKLRDSLPDSAILEPEKVRECLRDEDGEFDDTDSSDPVYAVNVKIPVGPFLLQRLVKL